MKMLITYKKHLVDSKEEMSYPNYLQYMRTALVYAMLLLVTMTAVAHETETTTTSGPTIHGSVYGGGALANTGNTTVNLTGGVIEGNVYGGGMGDADTEATVGSTEVNLNGTVTAVKDDNGDITNQYLDDCVVKGCIFGCNNINGTPLGNATVNIYKTQGYEGHYRTGKDAETEEREAMLNNIDDTQHSYELLAVYGGGNLAAYVPETPDNCKATVNIYGCGLTSIQTVYGGGNAASTPATVVSINGTYEIEEVFGGGNGKDALPDGRPNPGANVGYKNYTVYTGEGAEAIASDDENYDTKEKRMAEGSAIVYGTGAANVNIFGGKIHRVFGGSNTKGNVRITAVTLLDDQGGCDFKVDEAYGGGKSAPMDGSAQLLMACIPGLNAAYGGAEAANIEGSVSLNITNGNFDRVFGGNNISGTISGTITVNIEETGCHLITIGQLYGGGNQAAYTGPEIVDSENHGTGVFQGPTVNVRSFTSIGEVYGGGYGETATVKGDTYVNINVCEGKNFGVSQEDEVTKANEHTGDQLISFSEYRRDATKEGEDSFVKDADGNRILEEKNIHVYLPPYESGIGNIGNVYGGGNAAKVDGSTHVNIGTEEGDSITFETPTSDTGDARKHTVKGANIVGNVYGGGNNAEVTGNTNVVIGKKEE